MEASRLNTFARDTAIASRIFSSSDPNTRFQSTTALTQSGYSMWTIGEAGGMGRHTDYWLTATNYWLLATGYWLRATGS